jgi:hypothetical protein
MATVGREVDDDPVDGARVTAVDQRPLDPMDAFFDRRLGKAHENRFWQGTGRNIDLNLDRLGLDSEQRVRKQLGKHPPHHEPARAEHVPTQVRLNHKETQNTKKQPD